MFQWEIFSLFVVLRLSLPLTGAISFVFVQDISYVGSCGHYYANEVQCFGAFGFFLFPYIMDNNHRSSAGSSVITCIHFII